MEKSPNYTRYLEKIEGVEQNRETKYFFWPITKATNPINIPIAAAKNPHLKSIEPQTNGEKKEQQSNR